MELGKGAALHCLVRIELTNGTILTGRITDMDPVTMNMKVDALDHVAVRRQFTRRVETAGKGASAQAVAPRAGEEIRYEEEEVKPVALRCVNSVVVRGATVRYIDFVSEEATGGRGLEDIVAVANSVVPST